MFHKKLLVSVGIGSHLCCASRTGDNIDLTSGVLGTDVDTIERSSQNQSKDTLCCCYSGSSCSDGYKVCAKDKKGCSWAGDYCVKTVELEVAIGGTYNKKPYTESVACGGHGKCGKKMCSTAGA
jgi:hypothetical protein